MAIGEAFGEGVGPIMVRRGEGRGTRGGGKC